jgi:NAD(P)-dependent dehydrogenase (short-subunit alcohol dehydrogenase family)
VLAWVGRAEAAEAMELARASVTVNTVVPAAATAMTESVPALAPFVTGQTTGCRS